MPATLGTPLDRYIAFAERAVTDPSALEEEFDRIFASDATVNLFGETIRGREALLSFYRHFVSTYAELRHVWQTTENPDGSLHADWAASCRAADGTISAVAGVETAEVNESGQITSLVNTFTVPPGP
ncbi:hypothetical protein GCM10018793_49630 [Streptomyces sulfonofaciens]|uniref:SnoaL-like domain-containing protein n=1 Tax=Streptomyces sulfonofaciens TaxID=68272 RepID=A0A919GH27_9ACTN|nr:nuclear transport factor 2 family protein [Streptomyces sulfonofaciens]GHH84652.1 hypothetical protein GCM10018793_49630 [Streptomyces sulfonofaciens]